MSDPFSADAESRPVAQRSRSVESGESPGGGSPLTFVGLCCVVIGLYFLIIDPGTPVSHEGLGVLGAAMPTQVVNLQKLAIGQALTVAGSVFLAAAWRPR